MLFSQSSSTSWLHQAVVVEPGGWYEAGGRLRPQAGVALARIRIAWYASADASGSQLATVDSEELLGPRVGLVTVETGAVQAPEEARSGRLRIMLRPEGSGPATLVADDVYFVSVPPPEPTATPTPTSTPSATATPTPTPSAALSTPVAATTPTVAVAAGAAPSPSSSPAAADAPGPAATVVVEAARTTRAASTILIRITELLPDPIEADADAEFEWVELANVGARAAPLAGLRPGRQPGADRVAGHHVAAGRRDRGRRRARGRGRGACRATVRAGLFNGLGNEGDRVALLTADGSLVDVVSYGTDASYDQPPLRAPGPGQSLQRRFAPDGTLTAIAIAALPSPGSLEVADTAATDGGADAPAQGDATEALRDQLEDSRGANRLAWIVLATLAAAGLLGAGAFRAREILR